MLDKDEKFDIGSFWTSENDQIQLMEGLDLFSLTDVQECVEDPSSVIQLEDNENSDTTKSIGSNGTDGPASYQDLDSGSLTTPSSEKSCSTSEWPTFIPLETSAIQIQGNEIRHSPKHPNSMVTDESIQVQVPPLRVPIIRRLEDTAKEKRKNIRVKKSLDLQKKPLRRKSEEKVAKEITCKTKVSKRQYKRGRNLESEFEDDPSNPKPTVTLHHFANPTMQPTGNQQIPNPQINVNYYSANHAFEDDAATDMGFSKNSSMYSNVHEAFSSINAQRGNPTGDSEHHNFNQGAPHMISETRNQLNEQFHQSKRKLASHGNHVQGQHSSNPNVCVPSNEMFPRLPRQNFQENSNRGYLLDTNSNTSTIPISSNTSTPCNKTHQRVIHTNPERFDAVWSTSSLSPIERLFRNRISEVSEVGERCGDVQKFLKNSQLYKQLLAPIKDDSIKICEKNNEPDDGVRMTDPRKVQYCNEGTFCQGYDLPNEWTKVPSVPRPNASHPMRSADPNIVLDDFCMDFDDNIRQEQFSPKLNFGKMSGNPLERVAEINDHFSRNDKVSQSNSNGNGHSSSKLTQLPNWLKPHTIGKDYESMFMEILKLRFCVYSERARNGILAAENVNLRQMVNLERNLQRSWVLSAKNQPDRESSNNHGGRYFQTQENVVHSLNSEVNNLRPNGLMNPKGFDQHGIPSAFGQRTRENSNQRSGHQQVQNMGYCNTSDCNVVPPPQYQQRPHPNFGVTNMSRRVN